MEKIDKELLRRYLEHGGDAGVRERLREWFLEHDAEEEFTLREDDPVSGELYAFWERSLQRSVPQRTLDERYRALAGRLFGRKLRLQRLWRRLSQAAAVLLRAYNGLKAKVSMTSVSAAPSGAVPVESLTGTSGAVPLSPRAAVEQVYDAAVKAGKGGSVVINAVPAAQSVKGGKVGALCELTQDELSAYLSDSAVQKARSNRFDSSYLLCKEKDGSTIVVWYESEADIAEKTELCALLGIKNVYVLK